jgi:hypothetical protein
VSGYAAALKVSARPGHSEHQLGTTIDFKSYGGSAPWNYTNWATTRAGAWMAANAWKYGWVMSYPKAFRPRSDLLLIRTVAFPLPRSCGGKGHPLRRNIAAPLPLAPAVAEPISNGRA